MSNGSPVLSVDGTLYGVADGGTGPCQCGIVYELRTSAGSYAFQRIYEFKGQYFGPRPDGAHPTGPLVLGNNGELFGVTSAGGSAGAGTVFELTRTNRGYAERVLYSFLDGSDGGQPVTLLSFRGNLYGATECGGFGCNGTVFKLALSSANHPESVLYSFKGGMDGSIPSALLVDGHGNFYGITGFGGNTGAVNCPQGCGTVFELTAASGGHHEKILHVFQGGTDGGFPTALVGDPAGALYGTTGNGMGTVFKLAPAPGYNKRLLYAFPGGAGGWGPTSLAIDSTGTLYGTLQNAGINYAVCRQDYGCGTLFKLRPGRFKYKETTLYQFTGGADGAAPASVAAGTGGTVYGVTLAGGEVSCPGVSLDAGCGTVFRL